MRHFASDLRYALRALLKNPGFACAVILLLALGVGANALVFSLMDGILFRPLPFRDPSRLVAVWETTPNWDPKVFACYRDVQAFARQSRSFAALAGWQWKEYTLTGLGDARSVLGEAVTERFFDVLGLGAAQGRTFGPADLTGGPAVVLSDTGWQSLFGGLPGVAGRQLTLDGRSYTITGVMPRGFEFYPRQVQFWVLVTPADVARQASAKFHSMGIAGRLLRGVSANAAEAEIASVRSALEASDPDEIKHAGAMVHALQDELTWLAGRGLRSGLLLLFGAVGFVLLIACANVAGLLAGRALERRREIAIRAAMGCGRGRLLRLVLSENLLLSMLAAAAGCLLAYGGLRLFLALRPVELPIGAVIALNWRVLIFTAVLSVITALLSGFIPAWHASKLHLHDVLKEGGRGGSPSLASRRARHALVVFQIALSLTLLAGAALLIESLFRLRAEAMGYRVEGLLVARLDLPKASYPALADSLRFCEKLRQSLSGIPGLVTALRSTRLVHAEITGGRAARDTAFVARDLIFPEYFHVTGVPLVAGREFARLDTAQSEAVAIVDHEFTRRYFNTENPLGKHLRLPELGEESPWRTVVGVAGDIKETNPFDEMHWQVAPHVYVPFPQGEPGGARRLALMMRAGPRWLADDGQPRETLAAALRHAVNQCDSNLPLSEVTSMRQFLNQQAYSKPGFRAALLAVFAVVALAMAAVGLYGALSQLVSERRHDLGVRMALGATSRQVAALVVSRSLLLTAVGVVVGSAAAAAAVRVVRRFLVTGPGHPLVLLAVALVMLAVALMAGIAPAWRAARIDPVSALHEE